MYKEYVAIAGQLRGSLHIIGRTVHIATMLDQLPEVVKTALSTACKSGRSLLEGTGEQ